jgi:UDP-glucose 4-epimerase
MKSKGLMVVTGAAGFVGRRLVTMAANEGWQVRALARDSARIPKLANVEAMDWDLCQAFERAELLREAVVCHLAAMIPPAYNDPDYAESCHRVNALGTLEMLRAARSVESQHFIYTSSGNAYAPCSGLADEDSAVFPAARAPYYLSSKLVAEIFVEHFRLAQDLPSTILRLSAVYGPGMPSRDLIANFAEQIERGERLELRNAGLHRVDWVYLDDVARAILAVAEGRISGVYNVGSGRLGTAREVAETLVELLDADPTLIEIGPATNSQGTGFAGIDVTRARNSFDYSPRDLRSGLEAYVATLRR